MFYSQNVLVILQLLIAMPFATNELWTKTKAKVNANAMRPFLRIERPNTTRLLITQRHQPYYLACNATIEPSYYHSDTNYYFTWFRNHKILSKNEFEEYENGTLSLPPKEKAAGVYRCKINADTNAVISESITVEYPVLRRLHSRVNYTTIAGNSLTLNCPVQSVPPANISWYYGNVSLSKIFKDTSSYLILSNGSLVLRNPQPSESGKFKCVAFNGYALKTHHRQFVLSVHVLQNVQNNKNATQLTVNGKGVRGNYQLLPPLQDTLLYVPLNGDLNLTCCAISDNITIEWWFQPNSTSPFVKLLNNSREYHIRSCIEEYQGNYTCRTLFDEQTFYVIVTRPPSILKDLPVDEANIASSKTFNCLADGNPAPSISWYHNGEPFNSSYARYIKANQLNIPSFDPEESGIYQCFARNVAGEVYTSGELRLRNQSEIIPNPLKNIKCYPHTFNSINVTFENQSSESLYIVYLVYIGLSEPFRWMSPYPPMKLNASYVIIELPHVENLPYIRPFQIITRVLIPTSDIRMANKPIQKTVLSTLRSLPITCCTQGLPSRFVHIVNDTFLTWSVPDLQTKKYFIIQFVINETAPDPQDLKQQQLNGTIQHINLTQEDILRKLQPIEALNLTETKRILKNALSHYNNNQSNDVYNMPPEGDADIFSLVVPADVTGIMLRNFTRLKLRVLVITSENEHLAQDYRYVEWKVMENDTDIIWTAPYRLTIIESRMLRFHFDENLSEPCVLVCYLEINYPRLIRGERKCEQRNITVENCSYLDIRTLKPTTHYSLHFSSCDAKRFYGQYDVVTLPDPPGPISNQRVTRHNGLKLSWDPPLQSNGKIHHYNILWSLGNVTHEANVFECSVCFYKFPNISENAKINVSVRVVGETGVGAPIYIDLRNFDYRSLENENSTTNSEIYIAIAVGCVLSVLCILAFTVLMIIQRKRFMARPETLNNPRNITDINFGNLSNITGVIENPCDGNNTANISQECHEMQSLIPRFAGHPSYVLNLRPTEYEIVQDLPNGHTAVNLTRCHNINNINNKETINTTVLSDFEIISDHNLSVVPLCKTSPSRKMKHVLMSQEIHSKPFFIPFKDHFADIMTISQHHHQQQQQQQQQQHKKQSSSSHVVNVSPSSLPLTMSPLEMTSRGTNEYVDRVDACRSNSLNYNNNDNGISISHKNKQFHINFPKHAKSIDGICLLAEEEPAPTITPTSEMDINTNFSNNNANALQKITFETTEKNCKRINSDIIKQKIPTIIHAMTRTETAAKKSFTVDIPMRNNRVDPCCMEQMQNPEVSNIKNQSTTAVISLATSSKLQDNHYKQPDMDPNG